MPKFLIIVGEPSGDARGTELVQALLAQNARCSFYGAGGPKMRQAGVRIDHDLVSKAFVGFTDVVKHYALLKKIFNDLLHSVLREHPDGIILIDYPGFNLRFAKAVKLKVTSHQSPPEADSPPAKPVTRKKTEKIGTVPIFYYISPQIWAWGEKRIQLIKQVVNQMIVVFPFEEEIYRKAGVPVTFVGHPFLDSVKPMMTCREALQKFGLAPEKTTIALLPGSREDEVKRHLPVMLEAAQILSADLPNLQFVIAKPETLAESLYDAIVGTDPRARPHDKGQPRGVAPTFRIVTSHTYDVLHISDAAMVSSGSATLETALINVPMVVIYKTSWLNYLLGRLLVKIPHIALVNVVAGKRIVPELIQHHATGPAIAKAMRPMIGPVEMADYVREEFRKARQKLGMPGAAQRAAEIILQQRETRATAGIP